MAIVIGITDCNKWNNYEKWFLAPSSPFPEGEKQKNQIKIIKLSSKENNLSDLDKCDGVILSGGEDVHPRYYGKPELMERKEELKLEVNEERDKFEMKVIDSAYKKKIPMLGICRGLQIVNVYFKGTLIPDIGKESTEQHSTTSETDKTHTLKIESNSCLNGIITQVSGEVNSAHHQAADKVGEGLKISARAEDGTIEALEIKDTKQHPFLLLVQWHPERMNEPQNPLSSKIKEKFLEEIRKKKF